MSLPSYKVILLGDSAVGKTSICNRKLRDQFTPVAPTIGAGNSKIIVEVADEKVELNVWDTAGQEQYQSITPIYMKNTDIGIIVASLFDSNSINSIDHWCDSLKEHTQNVNIIIAINKTDIIGVPPFSISELSSMLSGKYENVFFVSAKSGAGINELFTQAGKLAKQKETPNIQMAKLEETEIKKEKSCC